MASVSIPNRPVGTDPRTIAPIIADFDAILNFLNGANLDQNNMAASIKDGTAGTPSLRTLGTGANQAMPGNTVFTTFPPAAVTALPGSPTNLQVILLQTGNDSITAKPNYWPLIYITADTKWYPIGGATPLVSEVATQETTASTSYVTLATAQSVTVPVAGTYDVEVMAYGGNDSQNGEAFLSFDRGATGAVDADAIHFVQINNGGLAKASQIAKRRVTGLAAGAAITLKARAAVTGSATWGNRRLIVTPVQLG